MNTYDKPLEKWWKGRDDGTHPDQQRWWQHIKLLSLKEELPDFEQSPVLLGFACDEGVVRNKGRKGSAEGPLQLRKILGNLPIHNGVQKYDVGTINCIGNDLERAQEQLAQAVRIILKHNGFPILLGGGHEILFGHFLGTSNYYNDKNVGIVNFDAHLDIRKPEQQGPSSGTGFYQVVPKVEAKEKDFLYLALGIQRAGNTVELFKRADDLKAEYIFAQDIHTLNLYSLKQKLNRFIDQTDVICLTVDLDVFAASIAPGVSAPTAGGIIYDHVFRELFKLLAQHEKVVSLDIAEYNPTYDIDSRTAKLVGQLVFDWVGSRYQK